MACDFSLYSHQGVLYERKILIILILKLHGLLDDLRYLIDLELAQETEGAPLKRQKRRCLAFELLGSVQDGPIPSYRHHKADSFFMQLRIKHFKAKILFRGDHPHFVLGLLVHEEECGVGCMELKQVNDFPDDLVDIVFLVDAPHEQDG